MVCHGMAVFTFRSASVQKSTHGYSGIIPGLTPFVKPLSTSMRNKPKILSNEIIAQTRIFKIERLQLRFANGCEVEFERLRGSGRGAVLVVPMLDAGTILLVREYAAGLDRYELAFPKGLMDPGETPPQAANREMQEEIGYAARDIRYLKTLSVAPGYANFETHVLLARDLYASKLAGDEPEPIEVVPWSLDAFPELLTRDDFVEARSIAALYLLQQMLKAQ